jgi:DNA-binding HxlR family transcriptional regulator
MTALSAQPPDARIEHSTCMAMTDILNRIGDKWSVMVVGMLSRHGVMRFNELKRTINGVSQRMLTLTLRNLERDGLVTRTIFPEIPPRVEYNLTELGRTLKGPIDALWAWSEEHGQDVGNARANYDAVHARTSEPPPRRYAGAVD